eukprot:gene18187-20001_t
MCEFQESESDWDSISGEGPDFGDISESVAHSKRQHKHKHVPKPPSTEKSFPSPKMEKAPLHKTEHEYRSSPRGAEQYRNINKLQNKGITTFTDPHVEINLEKNVIARDSRKNTPVSMAQQHFKEVELKDSSLKQGMFQSTTNDKRMNPHQLADSSGNLPYTDFEASNTSPRKKEPHPNAQARKVLHPEYITESPAPEPEPRSQHQTHGTRNQYQQSVDEDKYIRRNERSKKHGNRGRKPQSVIINVNADDDYDYDSGDTDRDFTWANHHHEEAEHVNEAASRDVVLKKSEQTLLEERYEYEVAVRNYHSMFTESEAKLPVLADKIESTTRRSIQEFFGVLQIVNDVFVIFIVETVRFLLKQFGRKLIAGVITAVGDFVTKPVLSAIFNSIIQPVFVLVWNVMHGLLKLLRPVLNITRELLGQVAHVVRAFRLVDVKTESRVQSL